MMAWRRDPATGEWEMVDAAIPDPMTQGMTGQEADPTLRPASPMVPSPPPSSGEGYSDPGMRFMPLPAEGTPGEENAEPPDNDDGYTDPDMQMIPPARPGEGAYQNEDYAAVDRWVQEVQARGNEVRKTAVGTFEVDSGGRIVSQMPSQYRMN